MTAARALRIAEQGMELEQQRRHAEMQPRLVITTVGLNTLQRARLINDGPVEYDRIVISLPPESKWALLDIDLAVGTQPSHARGREERHRYGGVLTLEQGLVVGGQADLVLIRKSLSVGGTVSLAITSFREEDSWRTSVPVELHRAEDRRGFEAGD